MEFNEEQILRYSRNIALKEIGGKGQEKLLNSSILVCGAGGLGSPVIAYLAAAGVGKIGIVDSDIIHISNLNRQIIHSMKKLEVSKVESAKMFIKNLNPDIKVDIHYERITIDNVVGIMSGYDIIIDCLDTLPLKFLMNDACVEASKPLIHAGIVALGGQTLTVIPGKTACLRCVIPDTPGCGTGPTCSQVGVLGACVGVLGSIQAAEAIKYLLGLPLNTNNLLIYDGLLTTFKNIKVIINKNCPVCSKGKMLSPEEYHITFACRD
ncbi:MAG: HesA/MoeB/ThiF family protein [Cyanobacteriota bacterium]